MPVYAEPEMSSPAACLPQHNLPMQTHSSPTQTERLAVHTHAQQPQPHDTQLLGHAPQPHTHGSPPHTHAPLAHASTTLGLLDSTSAATITPASPAQPAVLAPALDADMGTAPTPPIYALLALTCYTPCDHRDRSHTYNTRPTHVY